MLRFATSTSRLLALTLAGALLTLGLSACDSGGGPADDGTVEVGFQSTSPSSSSSSLQAKSSHSLDLVGNGDTLSIRDIRFIVEDFKLDGDEDSLDFNAPPVFVDLPLDETQFASAGQYNIPPRNYFEFEFEVDDLETDDDDSEQERQQAQELLSDIRNDHGFPDFPQDASMVVVGTFTPEGEEPQDFTSYLEAEIEVEREFPENNPLEITGDGGTRSLTVRMDPSIWFTNSNGDGGVRNLAEWQSTDNLLEIEEEFENGVVELEIDDD